MNKNRQVAAVFAVLRERLDSSYTGRELLQMAHLVVTKWHQSEREDPSFRMPQIGPLGMLHEAVDAAMRDGGWRVLEFERRRGMVFGDDDPMDVRVHGRRHWG